MPATPQRLQPRALAVFESVAIRDTTRDAIARVESALQTVIL